MQKSLYSNNRQRSFSSLLFAIYSFGLLVTMVIVTVFSCVYMSRMQSDMASNYNTSVIGRIIAETDYYLQQAVEISSYPYIYKEWNEQIKKFPEPPYEDMRIVNLVNIKRFDSSLLQMANSIVDYKGVYLFCENGMLYYSSSNLPSKYYLDCIHDNAYKNKDWYKMVAQADGGAVFLRSDQVENGKPDSFYIARLVKDSARKKEIGIYLMEVDIAYLRDLCSGFVENSSEACVIYDPNGNTIVSAGYVKNLPEDFFTALEASSQELSIKINERKCLVTYSTTNIFHLTICKIVPLSISGQTNRVTRITLIMFILLCLIFAFILFFVLSKQLSKPIEQLKSGMQEVEKGNYSVCLSPDINNELAELFVSFNSMTLKLKQLVERVFVEEMQKREAQIIALQSQINPHFLYNTLDSIQIVAINNKDFLASRMITSLSKIFRYAVSKNSNVCLKDELAYIDEYISLQKIRYKDSFSYENSVPEEFLNKPIMKLVLQPFVENCIQHGLRGLSKGLITIEAQYIEEGYEVEIKDNGKGMDQEKLTDIRKKLEQETNYERIGLFNVNARLKALYGANSGVFIDSTKGKGTVVAIRIIDEVKQHE